MKELYNRLKTLCVFREILNDSVIAALQSFLEKPDSSAYAAFASALYEANGGDLAAHVRLLCENSANVYVKTVGRGEEPARFVYSALCAELELLQCVCALTKRDLCSQITETEDTAYLPDFASEELPLKEIYLHRTENIGRYGYGMYARHTAFAVDEEKGIVPVRHPDKIALSHLIAYERERGIVMNNTKALLAGKPAANILLSGDAGTGKSTTVKAVANALSGEGLRIIEIRKDQLRLIPGILDELSDNPLKFILFIDDLSFGKDDDSFSALKAVLEGSVTARSGNVLVYATSNRRHIVKETFSDREGDDIHRNDTMQELVSLSERFGIHITFSRPTKETYLRIVRHLTAEKGIDIDDTELTLSAERFALERGGRSARLAGQFVDSLLSR